MLIILGGDSISKTTIQYEIVKMAYFNTHTRPHFSKMLVYLFQFCMQFQTFGE